MIGVPQFVRERDHLLVAAVEIHQHAAFVQRHHFHAKRAAALAGARRDVDPALGKGPAGKRAGVGAQPAKSLDDKVAGLGPGEAAIGARTAQTGPTSAAARAPSLPALARR